MAKESDDASDNASASTVKSKPDSADVAFYYPGPVWHSGDWIKSLLMFFDGVALLVPEYIRDKPLRVDPVVAEPLVDAGLLHILEPETLVDKDAARQLSDVILPIIDSGALDHLGRDGSAFDDLSYSRLGSFGDQGLADDILQRLTARGLARQSANGLTIPMHPTVRALVLVLLSQILRPYGSRLGFELSPATDRPQLVQGLIELLSLPVLPSKGQIVSFDLETVGVDLSKVPMDEVLAFRNEHAKEYSRYARALREFLRELSLLPEGERSEAQKDREATIREAAQDLRTLGTKAWKSPASVAFSVAGAVWTLKTGDPLGAALALASATLGASGQSREVGAYSYLFQIKERYG